METWKAVVGFEGIYEVSDAGRVRRIAKRNGLVPRISERIMKPYKMKNGYLHMVLQLNEKCCGILVHRAVIAAFIGPAPLGHEVNHKNGNKNDNRLENLEYVTPSQNQVHSHQVLGIKGSRAKLTEKQVIAVRELRSHGWLFKDIAQHFGVDRKTCADIVNCKTWTHI
jgi:hypothetical protein